MLLVWPTPERILTNHVQLGKRLRKGQLQSWNGLELNAESVFHALNGTSATPSILLLRRRSDHIIVETDACDRQPIHSSATNTLDRKTNPLDSSYSRSLRLR